MEGNYVGMKTEKKVPPTFNRRLDFPVLPLDLVHCLVLLLLLLPLSLFELLLLLLPLLPLVLLLAGLLCRSRVRGGETAFVNFANTFVQVSAGQITLSPRRLYLVSFLPAVVQLFFFFCLGQKKIKNLPADFYSYLRDFQQNSNYLSSPSKTHRRTLANLRAKFMQAERQMTRFRQNMYLLNILTR